MAGVRLVLQTLVATVIGLAAVMSVWTAEPACAQPPSEQRYPEYPPSYRNTGNVITQGPRDGEVILDFANANAQDPLANRSPGRNSDYRAAERWTAGQPAGRPLSESFDPAQQPTSPPPAMATGPAATPPPGTTRLPASVPPRGTYPSLAGPPVGGTRGGLPPVQPLGGPLSAPPASAVIPPPNEYPPANPAARMAQAPSPLGPPAPPNSLNPDLVGEQSGPVGPVVVDVRVEGNETIKPDRIRPHVKCRKGRPLDTLQVEEDVRRLLATRMFVAVRPKYITVPGGVTVLFQVLERPTLKYVKYTGSHLKDRTLAKQTGLKKGSIADPFAVEEGRVKLEQYFRDRGHNKVRVTVSEGLNPGDRGVVYVVHEGPIPRVRSVNFINNTIANDARLRTQVSSKTPWFRIPGIWHGWKGFADPEKINADVDTLTDYYRGLGHFSGHVSREVVVDDTQQWADITFVINEGPRYSLRTVSFIGQKRFTEVELQEKLKLKPGDFFDRNKMKADVQAIEEKYGSKGYVFADIEASPRFELEPGQLDLVFKVSEGRRCRVGKITVEVAGENPHTRRLAILNRLSFRPGDIMDTRKLRDSERRLQASGLFLFKPQEGKEPKITFTPPLAETENLVENPDAPDRKVRGQSPDTPPGTHTTLRPQVADDRELIVNLSITGELLPVDESGNPLTIEPAAQDIEPAAEFEDYDPTLPMLDPRWDDRRMQPTTHQPSPAGDPAMLPSRSAKLPAGAIIRGQSPDGEQPQLGSSTRTNGLAWRPPQPPATRFAAYPAGTGPAAASRPPLVRAQGGDVMPSFNVQQQLPPGRAPQAARYAQPAPAPSAPLPPSRQVVSPNGTPIATPYVAQASPPGGFAPSAQPVPNDGPPSWMTPNPQPAPSGVAPPVNGGGPVAAQPPGVLPPPGGYDNPGQAFGPGERDWLGDEEPPIDVPVNVLVEETQTGRLMLGVGVNSNAGLVGSAVIDEQNFDFTRIPRSWADVVSGTAFRGAGQHFRVEAMPGTQFQRYLVSFTEPYLFDTPVLFGINGSYFVRQYLNWTEQRLGGRVNLGYQLAPDLTVGGALRAESINISNPSVPTPASLAAVVGNNALYTARVNIVQDTRDSAFMPTQGRRISAAFEQGFGDFSYPRGEFEATQYFLLRQRADGSGRHTLRLGGQFAISGSDTPIFENFFAGGYSTIRGFRFRGASPTDLGVQTGGRLMILAGAEYMYPITADDMLRGVFFCDTGTVEPDLSITADDYRIAVGAGLRIQVPMMGPAPIALDFAVPITKAEGDQTQVLSFFVGVQY